MKTQQVDTRNDFLLAGNGNGIIPMLPMRVTDRQQAYRTAAWLVSMAAILPDDGTRATFQEVLSAVSNT